MAKMFSVIIGKNLNVKSANSPTLTSLNTMKTYLNSLKLTILKKNAITS